LDIPSIVVTPPNDDVHSTPEPPPIVDADTQAFIDCLHSDILDTCDSFTAAKISQAHHANTHRSPNLTFAIGDHVMLATSHH
jgi:hypothetical protein